MILPVPLLHVSMCFQECLAAQLQQPLLPQLRACLDDSQQLVTSCLAVQQFQKLADLFAGPKEKQRWEHLLQRVTVYHCSSSIDQQDGPPSVCTCCGTNLATAGCGSSTPSAAAPTAAAGQAVVAAADYDLQHCVKGSNNGACQQQQQLEQLTFLYTEPQRISQIDKLGKQQRAVFGLGDALQALTLTANGNAVRCCEQYGVKLEVVLHRPVWLTGM